MTRLPCVEVEPATPAEACVIWLHGLGADGHDFEPLVPILQPYLDCPVRFVFPHAPERPLSMYAGMPATAWFDIFGLGEGELRQVEPASLREAVGWIEALIEREIERGIPAERVILAGFSQGGALAYAVALQGRYRLAGLVALSTYLPGGDDFCQHLASSCRQLPIFAAHGVQDSVVPFRLGSAAWQVLRAWGFEPEWREYPMGHEVIAAQIEEIALWLQARLKRVD